jgi:hypothetical protein
MKRWLVGLSLVLGVLFITPAPVAHAWSWSAWWSNFSSRTTARKNPPKQSQPKPKPQTRGKSKGHAVPELDPGAAGAAMVLLLGGVAVLARRGKKKEPSFLA